MRAPISLTVRGELLLRRPIETGRPAYIAAASGLVRCGDWFYVVADDELHLGVFPAGRFRPGSVRRLLPGRLPRRAATRKEAKPDFEALASWPSSPAYPFGALLILGSGSRRGRARGAIVGLTPTGRLARAAPRALDVSSLYRALARELGVLNVEGAVIQRDALWLFQRGNDRRGANAMVELDLAAVRASLARGGVAPEAVRSIRKIELGNERGVPYTFTDACALPDGRLLALAVAEDTRDAFADGATLGACLCQFDHHNRIAAMTPLSAPAKPEGVAVWSAGHAFEDTVLAFVTDADDPDVPARLMTARGDAFPGRGRC